MRLVWFFVLLSVPLLAGCGTRVVEEKVDPAEFRGVRDLIADYTGVAASDVEIERVQIVWMERPDLPPDIFISGKIGTTPGQVLRFPFRQRPPGIGFQTLREPDYLGDVHLDGWEISEESLGLMHLKRPTRTYSIAFASEKQGAEVLSGRFFCKILLADMTAFPLAIERGRQVATRDIFAAPSEFPTLLRFEPSY